MHRTVATTAIAALALSIAACSQPAPAAKEDMSAMKEGAAAPAAVTSANGRGVITAIDAAAGRVTLDHEPIAELNWPQMVMAFPVADPAQLQGLSVGDAVTFELQSNADGHRITGIRK